MVSEAKSGFVVTDESGELSIFSSGSVELSSQISDGGREGSVLVSKGSDLVLKHGDLVVGIGQSSLEVADLGGESSYLGGKIVDSGR